MTGGGMSGGYRKYLCNVIPRMALHPEVEALLCASPESLNVRGWFGQLPKVKFVNSRALQFLHLFHDSELNQRLEEFSPNVIFVPVGRFFRFKEVPVVNMVQNMEPIAYSGKNNPVSEKIRNLIRKKVSLSAFNASQRIIAISQYVKTYLISEFDIPKTKIGVVYHGASDIETTQSRPQALSEECKGRFVFTAGSIRPARGLEDIIYAVAILARKQINVKLVIAGYTAPNMLRYKSTLENHIAANSINDRVIWTGTLSAQEMDWCYKNSLAFVMTSRVESFGIMATEAMAAGCICIAANNSCLPEIFADAAIFYSPGQYTLLAEAIVNILNFSGQKLNEAVQKALKRRAFFSWDTCAEQTVTQLIRAVKD